MEVAVAASMVEVEEDFTEAAVSTVALAVAADFTPVVGFVAGRWVLRRPGTARLALPLLRRSVPAADLVRGRVMADSPGPVATATPAVLKDSGTQRSEAPWAATGNGIPSAQRRADTRLRRAPRPARSPQTATRTS